MLILALLLAAAFAAGAVQTLVGFGAGVIMMMVLPSFFDMITAPAITNAATTLLPMVLAWRFRRQSDWRRCVFPAGVYLAFSILAISVAGRLDLTFLQVLFSLFLILLALYYLLIADKVRLRATGKSAFLCSAFSGLFSGWFGIGGPLMTLYFLAASDSKESFVGNVHIVYTLVNVVNIALRASRGIYTAELLPVIAVITLGTMAGRYLGLWALDRVDKESLKKIVYCFIAAAGLVNLAECLF